MEARQIDSKLKSQVVEPRGALRTAEQQFARNSSRTPEYGHRLTAVVGRGENCRLEKANGHDEVRLWGSIHALQGCDVGQGTDQSGIPGRWFCDSLSQGFTHVHSMPSRCYQGYKRICACPGLTSRPLHDSGLQVFLHLRDDLLYFQFRHFASSLTIRQRRCCGR